MKVRADANALLKSLEEAKKIIKNKAEFVVQETIYEALAIPAVDNTPYGDLNKYYDLYKHRTDFYGLPFSAGLAKGGWNVRVTNKISSGVINSGSTFGILDGSIDTINGSLSKARMQAQLDHFKLGDNIWVYNRVPYVHSYFNGKSLESGNSEQAPFGIKLPTIDAFINLYKGTMVNAIARSGA